MQLIYQFFRLIRLSNILVIVLTMCVFYAMISLYHLDRLLLVLPIQEPGFFDYFNFASLGLSDFNFVLLIISVVLIAASGNMINDYFDQKADRVNKPNRLIIGKYIKRRWAIILNWTFNGIGLVISLYLSYILSNWWIVAISFLSINLLYFYSAIYKRKFLSGNLIVAFLTALVPLEVFVYGAYSNFNGNSPFKTTIDSIFISDIIVAIIAYCGFAFLLNFIREIIKDMADVKGDLLLQSQTFPIRFGFKKTKYFLSSIYFLALIPFLLFLYSSFSGQFKGLSSDQLIFTYLILTVGVVLLGSFLILIARNQRKYYLIASNLIKVAMLFGILSALFYT